MMTESSMTNDGISACSAVIWHCERRSGYIHCSVDERYRYRFTVALCLILLGLLLISVARTVCLISHLIHAGA